MLSGLQIINPGHTQHPHISLEQAFVIDLLQIFYDLRIENSEYSNFIKGTNIVKLSKYSKQ